EQQQAVAEQGQRRQDQGIDPGQGRGGDGQRDQVIGNEGVAGAAGEEQQHAVDDQVAGQLHGVFLFGDRPLLTQAQRGEQAQQAGNAQGDGQRDPGQHHHAGQPGDTHGRGLGAQHQDTDQDQPPQVLAVGGKEEKWGSHSGSGQSPEYNHRLLRAAAA